jgi:serine/threonine-protein kinase
MIVFSTATSGGLLRVPVKGGEPEQLIRIADGEGETQHWWPQVLPNGKGVLFTAWSGTAATSRIAVVSLQTGNVSYLVSGSYPRYASTGHIIYGRESTLRAVGFDADRLELSGGDSSRVAEDVLMNAVGAAGFALAEDGSLVYEPASAVGGANRTLVWVDRQGREEPLGLPPRAYIWPRLSPDGKRLAVAVEDGDIWVSDVERPALNPLTTDGRQRRAELYGR